MMETLIIVVLAAIVVWAILASARDHSSPRYTPSRRDQWKKQPIDEKGNIKCRACGQYVLPRLIFASGRCVQCEMDAEVGPGREDIWGGMEEWEKRHAREEE